MNKHETQREPLQEGDSIILVLQLVSVVMLILVILIIVLVNNGHNGCKLSTTMPDVERLLKAEKDIASSDNKALANMIGYLFFYDRGFLPIVLTKLNMDDKRITLASECVTLTWEYNHELFFGCSFELVEDEIAR